MIEEAILEQIRNSLYINGAWVSSTGGESIAVRNPTTEEVIGQVPAGTLDDIDRAVKAAAAAFPAWSQAPIGERAEFCCHVAVEIDARQDELATLIAREVGTPLRIARQVQVGLP